MCFGGGGGGDQYDAHKSGDFRQWQALYNHKAGVQQKLARGELTPAQAQAEIAKLSGIDALGEKIKGDPSGNMEMREVTRQGDVGMGRIKIDQAFNKFDPKYYDKYKTDYQNYYMPELNKQHTDAVDKLTAAMADRGMLESTVGTSKFGDLAKENLDARTNITNEANDASKKLRGTVENAKTNMYNLNEASANPQAVNAQAVGQATALVAPPTYSPLGKVFADFLGGLSNFQGARTTAPKQYTTPFTSPSGYGSGSVVGGA